MSAFEGLTPTLRLVVRNPLLRKEYPEDGEVVAVVDTGYEGFLAVPRDVYVALSLAELRQEKRRLVLANRDELDSEGAYGSLSVPELGVSAQGFIETYEGIEEILVGVEALSGASTTLDYCGGEVRVVPCAARGG